MILVQSGKKNRFCCKLEHKPVLYVDGSVHRNNIPMFIQQDATLHSLFYLEIALHVSVGTSTHHQESKQLYVQYRPLLLVFTHNIRTNAGIGLLKLNDRFLENNFLLEKFQSVPPFIYQQIFRSDEHL